LKDGIALYPYDFLGLWERVKRRINYFKKFIRKRRFRQVEADKDRLDPREDI